MIDRVEMTLMTLRKKRATGRGTHMLLIFHRREKDKIEQNKFSECLVSDGTCYVNSKLVDHTSAFGNHFLCTHVIKLRCGKGESRSLHATSSYLSINEVYIDRCHSSASANSDADG